MVDLTGGFAMSVKLKQNINRDLVFISLKSFDKRLIMTSCIMPKGARQGTNTSIFAAYKTNHASF